MTVGFNVINEIFVSTGSFKNKRSEENLPSSHSVVVIIMRQFLVIKFCNGVNEN
jgi:hypothetical protein